AGSGRSTTTTTVRACAPGAPNGSAAGAGSLSSATMAITQSREILIEASPDEVLEFIAAVESLPEWSPAHQRREESETGDDGRPSRVKMAVKMVGITDEQEVAYTWTDTTVSWTLVSASQQRSQDATYTLTPEGKGTRVKFEITIDP